MPIARWNEEHLAWTEDRLGVLGLLEQRKRLGIDVLDLNLDSNKVSSQDAAINVEGMDG